jgi:hypothetical protein
METDTHAPTIQVSRAHASSAACLSRDSLFRSSYLSSLFTHLAVTSLRHGRPPVARAAAEQFRPRCLPVRTGNVQLTGAFTSLVRCRACSLALGAPAPTAMGSLSAPVSSFISLSPFFLRPASNDLPQPWALGLLGMRLGRCACRSGETVELRFDCPAFGSVDLTHGQPSA